jgi:hypothetical protein
MAGVLPLQIIMGLLRADWGEPMVLELLQCHFIASPPRDHAVNVLNLLLFDLKVCVNNL